MPSSSTFGRFPITPILHNVRDASMIPQHFPRSLCINTTLSVKGGSFIVHITAFHVAEELLACVFQLITVIMIASNDRCRGNNLPIFVEGKMLLVLAFFRPW